MERDGWVTRQPDPDDGRANLVVLTEEAVNVWEKLSQTVRAMLDQAYRGIHPSEIETVKRVLERVRRNIGA
jgi:DNA-binding MarR family transcriptional regulator